MAEFGNFAGDYWQTSVYAVENEIHSGGVALALHRATRCIYGLHGLQRPAAQLGVRRLQHRTVDNFGRRANYLQLQQATILERLKLLEQPPPYIGPGFFGHASHS